MSISLDHLPSTSADETNPLADPAAYHQNRYGKTLELTLKGLSNRGGRITRLRLMADYGSPWVDISYIHGELPDGTPVRVIDYPGGLTWKNLKRDLIQWAREEKVYAKQIGLLDEWGTWSVIR